MLLAESADPSKAAVAARHGGAPRRAGCSKPAPARPRPSCDAAARFGGRWEHSTREGRRTASTTCLAGCKAEFNKVQGNLVDRQAVEDAACSAGRMLRDQFLGLAPQLAAELVAMSDPWDIEKHLVDAFRRVFTEDRQDEQCRPFASHYTELSLCPPDTQTVPRCTEAYCRGLKPDPDLWVDEWSDEYMRIPRDTGAAEPGKYRTARTPYAREPMRCLSPAHPCKRVVTKVASQLMKTQIALNWIGALIHMAPSNILTLLPSLGLAKRVSSRIR